MADSTPAAGTIKPNVARAGGIMMLALFLSRVLGIVREMVINWKFGQSEFTDAYRTAFQVPDLLFYLISAGALSQAFIPVFSEYYHTNRHKEAWQVFSEVVSICALAVLGFIVICWGVAAPLAHMLAPHAKPEIVSLIAGMSRILVPTQFAFLVGGLLMGTLYARQVFTVPGLGPSVYNIGIILGGTVFSLFLPQPIVGLVWGALVGAFVGTFFLPLRVIIRMGMEFRPSLSANHEGTRKVFKLMVPIIFGLSLPSVFPLITRYFGNYYETGTVSALENMNQLMQAPLGIFGQSLAIAVLPALSQFVAEGNMDRYRDQLSLTVRNCIFLSAPFVALFIAFPEPIIRVLFEHGKFTAADTARTAPALMTAGIGIVGWCLQPVLMRGFFALHRTLPPVILGTICTAIYVAFCTIAVKVGWSHPMLPLAGSVCALLMSVAMLVVVQRYCGTLDTKGMAVTFGKATLAAAVGAILLVVGKPFILAAPKLAGIGLTVVLGLAFAWAYYFVARMLKMPETSTLSRALARRSANSNPT